MKETQKGTHGNRKRNRMLKERRTCIKKEGRRKIYNNKRIPE